MEVDLGQLGGSSTAGDLLRAEICIIGAGIAGLTLAHKLVQLGHDVLVLEAGGHAPSGENSSADVLQAGHPHPGTSEDRVRAVGGTSLVWGGQLLPLPPDSGWPVSSVELAVYTAEAERMLRVDDLPYTAPAFFTQLQQQVPALLQASVEWEGVVSKFAPFGSRNLAQTLLPLLRSQRRAKIVLYARAIELLLSPTRDRIEAVLVRAPGGRELRIYANQFVLAAGTLQTVRLLLASRSSISTGVGNEYDQVGRNFHDHLTLSAATVPQPARAGVLASLRPWVVGATVHSLKLAPSARVCAQLQLPPMMAHLTIAEPESSGVGALRGILRGRQQSRLPPALRTALPQLPRALYDTAQLTWSARMYGRRYVSPRARVLLRINAAQRTPSGSRIELSSELDRENQPKAVLDWRVGPDDLASLRRFTAVLQRAFEAAYPDRIDWNPALLDAQSDAALPDLNDARHAMGGACMGTDPRRSVVTPELRVHSVRNLFLASPATFPDGSPQLPTLPLMSLTLRLAQHLHQLCDR